MFWLLIDALILVMNPKKLHHKCLVLNFITIGVIFQILYMTTRSIYPIRPLIKWTNSLSKVFFFFFFSLIQTMSGNSLTNWALIPPLFVNQLNEIKVLIFWQSCHKFLHYAKRWSWSMSIRVHCQSLIFYFDIFSQYE